jgi:hypothetical protein
MSADDPANDLESERGGDHRETECPERSPRHEPPGSPAGHPSTTGARPQKLHSIPRSGFAVHGSIAPKSQHEKTAESGYRQDVSLQSAKPSTPASVHFAVTVSDENTAGHR